MRRLFPLARNERLAGSAWITTPSMTLTLLYLIGCYKDGVPLVPEQQPSWALVYLGLEAR